MEEPTPPGAPLSSFVRDTGALVASEAERADAILVIDGDRADFDALAEAGGILEVRDLSALQ